MQPQRQIPVPDDALEAAIALRARLNAAAPDRYTVGVGLKQTQDEFTDQLALFVYVPRKRAVGEVAEAELVPAEFAGYVTDVVETRPTLIEDTAFHNPLSGGIQISREQLLTDGIFTPPSGTLGAIVRSRDDGSQQLLTCAHVVERSDLNIFQPAPVFASPGSNQVGTVFASRREFTPIFLDCAVVDLNGSRGTDFSVRDIGPIKGVSTQLPALGALVKKRGARTLVTQGFVVRLGAATGAPVVDQFEIISAGIPFVTPFAGGGDSGSVLLNASDEVIGLLFAIPNENLGTKLSTGGLAMPIHNVQEALQIDIAT